MSFQEVTSFLMDGFWISLTIFAVTLLCGAPLGLPIAFCSMSRFKVVKSISKVIVAKKDAGIASAADLAGKVAAVESGSAGESYAKTFEGVTAKGFIKQTDCLFEVNAGTADFAVLDAQLAKSYAGKGDYANIVIIDSLSSDVEYYAIGFKKGSELTAKVNEQLEKLAKDGTIAKLAEKYGVANTAITDFSDQK